jgi:hypothetical protein
MTERTSLRPTELAELAIDWWCPDRFADIYGELTTHFVNMMEAYDARDFSTWYQLLNRAAIGCLGYTGVREEDALLGYLEDLCRGYFDHTFNG